MGGVGKRRALAGAVVAAFAVVALAVVAVAQDAIAPPTTVTVKTRVIPNKAGTKRNPQGVKIRVAGRLHSPAGYEPPIVTKGWALFPRNGNWNGGRYPKCNARELQRDGTEACPKRSRIGRARATALADSVVTHPKVEIFNGGQNLGLGYVTLYNPAFVQQVVPARIKELRSRKWKYRVSISIPRTLQVVAGVPIFPRAIKGQVGRGNIIETTSCPRNRRWPYRYRIFFDNTRPFTDTGSTPCRPSGRRR